MHKHVGRYLINASNDYSQTTKSDHQNGALYITNSVTVNSQTITNLCEHMTRRKSHFLEI